MNNVAHIAPEAKVKEKGKSHKGTGQRMDLTMAESFALMKLMEAEYASSGLNDTEFAEYAMTKIKLRPGIVIKNHNMKQRRDQLGIPSNRGIKPSPDQSALAAMVLTHEQTINDLKERIMLVEGWIKRTFPSKGI